MRGNLLDELGKPYVVALRAKGLPERKVIYKHAVRNALHPLVMALGQTLAWLISGFTIISLVLDLPTIQSVYMRGYVAAGRLYGRNDFDSDRRVDLDRHTPGGYSFGLAGPAHPFPLAAAGGRLTAAMKAACVLRRVRSVCRSPGLGSGGAELEKVQRNERCLDSRHTACR